jgi:outer membrane protein insertion porin family
MRGLGPYSGPNALGGVMYWAGGLHLYTPLPFRHRRGAFGEIFRTHFFINAGNLLAKEASYHEVLNVALQNFR